MRLIDADELKKHIQANAKIYADAKFPLDLIIDNAPTVELETKLVANVTFNKEEVEELVEKAKADVLAQIERPQGEWIPIKMRPGTDEEYEKFSQYGDCPREDFRVFECPLPDDEQKVLVTTQWGNVCTDVWYRDVDCCYFEDNSDDDDVIAWMPLPEAYKKPEQLGGES